MTANNCTNPPHFPPHCGCPAGYAPQPSQMAVQAPSSAPVAPSFNPAFAGSVNPALAFLLGGVGRG